MIRYLAFVLLLWLPQLVQAGVIVNPGVPLEQSSRQFLLSVFTLKTRTWPDGQAIHVYILPPQGESHRRFVKDDLKLFPYQLVKIWDRAVFSGAAKSPTVVHSAQEMLMRVASQKGAIGYVLSDLEGGEGVRLLQIQ